MVRCLESLNWLAGRRERFSEHDGSEPGACQLLFKQEAHAQVEKRVNERSERASAIPLLQAAFRELLGSRSVYGPDENGNLANFSTVKLVSLLETLLGALVSTMMCLEARATFGECAEHGPKQG